MDYLTVLKNKAYLIIRMVYLNGSMTYENDYFMVAIPNNDEKLNKQGVHEYGTSFVYKSLLELYSRDFREIMNQYGIEYKQVKRSHVFKLKQLSEKVKK